MTDRDEAESGAPDVWAPSEPDALVDRLRVIEDQPLEDRAGSYAQVHDALQARLDGG